jgi:8-oxo-dGTP pyrophosphatase MutT (NUDIX family)
MNFQELKRRKRKKTNIQYCNNCGMHGHPYRKCTQPITSYGIICYKIVDGKIYYIVVRRRNSLSFTEFLRGRYRLPSKDPTAIEYISMLLSKMTKDEQEHLLTQDFDSLWGELWSHNKEKHQREKARCLRQFDEMKKGFHIDDKLITLEDLIRNIDTTFEDSEWGFPKGKRKAHEKNEDCASREFCEETNFDLAEFEIIPHIHIYEELFTGSNNKNYRNIYYVAKCLNVDIDLAIDPNNIDQAGEIDAIVWCSAEECVDKFRDYYPDRRRIILEVDELLSNVVLNS